MVAHQTKGKDLEVKANNRAAKKINKVLPVLVIKEDRLPIIPPRGHVIHGAGKLNSPRPGHEKIITRLPSMSNIIGVSA